MVLRDARNHVVAHITSKADLPVTPSLGGEVIAEICGDAMEPIQKIQLIPPEQRLMEIFDVLRALSPLRSYSEFVRLLGCTDRREVIREIGALSHDGAPVAQLLSSEIASRTKESTWLRSLIPQTPLSGYCTLAGLFVGIAGFALIATPAISFIATGLGAALNLVGILSGPAEKLSILRASG